MMNLVDCVYHLTDGSGLPSAIVGATPTPRMSVSSDGCIGSDCSTNSSLSPAIIGATTAALLLVLLLSTTVVVIGIAVGICRRKKQQQNMVERSR